MPSGLLKVSANRLYRALEGGEVSLEDLPPVMRTNVTDGGRATIEDLRTSAHPSAKLKDHPGAIARWQGRKRLTTEGNVYPVDLPGTHSPDLRMPYAPYAAGNEHDLKMYAARSAFEDRKRELRVNSPAKPGWLSRNKVPLAVAGALAATVGGGAALYHHMRKRADDDSLRARFEEKLERSGGKQRWTGSTNNIGYPKMKVDGEMVLGSHVALRLAGRKVPTGGPAGGKIVMHKDNDKLNLAPSNLEVGTHKANLKQMRDEGRDRPRGVHQEPDVREVDGEKVSSRLRDAVSFAEEAIGRLGKKYTMRLAGEPVGHMTVYSPARWDKPGIGDVAANVVGSTQIDPKFHGMGLGKKLYGEVMRRQPGGLLASDNDVSGEAARVWQGMPRRKYRLRVAPDLTRSGKKDGFSSSGRYGRPFEAQLPAASLQATKTAPSDVDILKYAFQGEATPNEPGVVSRAAAPAVALGLSGAALAGSGDSVLRAAGYQRIHHGTSRSAAKSIREHGLDPAFGGGPTGSSAAVNNERFIRESTGKVHVSSSKGLAGMFSRLAQAHADSKATGQGISLDEAHKIMFNPLRPKGEVLTGAMPFTQFRSDFEVDPDAPLAFRSTKKVDPHVFRTGALDAVRAGVESPGALGKYIRKHPVRFASGVGGVLLPTAAVAGSGLWLADRVGDKVAFKLQGHTEHQGIPIAIENRKGSVRKGVDKDGKPWRTVMKLPYGYIKGSTGADGEGIDCYVGPHKDAPNAYVVHQRKSDGTGYDEDKILFGLRNKEEATKGYLAHYNSDKFLGPVKEVPVERLKEMLSTGKRLEKISAARPVEVLKAIHAALPRGQRILKEDVLHPMTRNRLVSHVRMELNNVLPEVPFHQRLKSYKDFKSTGALGPVRPRYNRETKGVTYRHSASGDPVESARLLPAADDTVTLHSYGKDISLGKALKDPATRMDHPFLMPGRTRPTTHGMYFFEEGSTPANAARYAAHGEGSPSRLEIKVPRSKVLHYDVKGGERVVSADDIKSYAHTARIDPVKLAAMCARAFRGFCG